jgi:hypothetical protein
MRLRRACLALAAFAGLVLGSSAAPAANQAFAVLAGGFEVPPNPSGFGTATLLFTGPRTICYAVLIEDVTATGDLLMHIHKAPPGVDGPIVVNLKPPTSGDPGRIANCVGRLDPALVTDIKNNPTDYYINFHNGDFPGGAVRGQLF